MKVSIFTTATDPDKRGDPWKEAIASYADIADEIVIVAGDSDVSSEGWADIKYGWVSDKIKVVHHPWPNEFSWEFIGQQFQRGYEACTGDIVIHADLDYVWHERDIPMLQIFLGNMMRLKIPAMTMFKYQFLLADRYNLKSRVVNIVNKADYGDRIRFDAGGDLCQPSLDGVEIKPDDARATRIPFWNYDFTFKTIEQVKADYPRFARAWAKHFGEYNLGGPDEESAFAQFMKMQMGRLAAREHKIVAVDDHPKYIRERIKALTPEQFGHSMWGAVEGVTYVQEP